MTTAFRYSASDIAALIGTPWQEGAVGPDAYDCWAAAGMVEERFFGRRLPGLGDDRRTSIARARTDWRRAQTPREGDIVEMRRMGRANHVGVWIAGGVLHCQRGAGMVYDRPDAIRAMGWRMRFWTPGKARRGRGQTNAARALYVPGLDLLMGDASEPEALLAAHRAVPVAARAGERVLDVIRRAGLEGESVAVFLRDAQDRAPVAWPEDGDPEALERLLYELGAVRPEAFATTRIGEGQRLVITQVPQGGGGGSNPLRLVLQIAVLAAAAFAAPLLGPGIAAGLGIGAQAGSAIAFGALNLVGGFVVNAILPPPSPPALSNFSEEVSPTFSARAQPSIARPGAPVPIQFGRHIHQLDDVSPPFVRFENDKQIVYQLLALGVGEHALEEVRLGNTTVWRDGALTGNLPGVSIEHVLSGQPVTLMDEAVFTQADVTGLSLSPNVAVGWHSALPAGQVAVALEVDIAFQQLVTIDSQGNNQTRAVDVLVEAQMIDDDDQPLGDPVTLETLTFSAATREALRSSHKWFVPQGRYRVRLTRQTAEGGDQTFDDAVWAGLKGILPGGRTWPGIELLAVRVEVGEEFAGQSARQVRAVKTRKLPVWDGTAWTAPQPTREIAWAVAEIARAHGRLGDLDLDELLALHATWSDRGDRFDAVIDQRMSLWEVLQAALRAGRAQPDQLGRRIRLWRDAPQPIPRQLFSALNIRRGSLSIRPRLPVSERPERLVAQFMDERTWRPGEIAVGAITGRERRERYFGIVNKDHLLREVGHDFRAARFRSVTASFEAELENRLLLRGDPIALSHPELTDGVAVTVEAWSGLTITLGRDIATPDGTGEIVMRISAPDGSVIGPFPVTPPAGQEVFADVAVTQEEMDRLTADYGADPREWVARGPQRDEAIRGVIGRASTFEMRLIVQEVGEERDGYAPITCVDDDPLAHEFQVASDGALDGAILALSSTTAAGPGGDEITVEASIAASFDPALLDYLFEYATDGGVVWQPLGTSETPSLTVPEPAGLTDLRVAAVRDGRRGPWVSKSLAPGALAAPANLAEVTPGLFASEARLHVSASPVTGAALYRFELRDASSGTMAIRFRSTPELDLTLDDLEAAGALSRNTVVRLAAVAASGVAGSEAELAMPLVQSPGGIFNVFHNNGVVTWTDGTPPATRGWLVEWAGGSQVVETPQFWRGTASWADPLTFSGLDAFGPGFRQTISFLPPPPTGDETQN